MDNFTVIDDFIPLTYQTEIEKLLLSPQFPWYFSKDVTYNTGQVDSKGAPALSHLLKEKGSTTSQYFSFFLPMAYVASEAVRIKFNDVLRCRTFLQLPLNDKFIDSEVDSLHIDDSTRHLVLLYYVLDADGDTIIVDKEFVGSEEKNLKYNDYNIVAKVKPKKGRALIFDGRYYHTAEQPKSNIRCVINFNIV
jgi:hypothetical protein